MNNNILIIEDNSDINNMIRDALIKQGYSCTQAYSGTEGMLNINNSQFDLILLDLMLPGLNGEDLIKKIRPEVKTPIIVISAKDELDSKVDVLTSGADDYITKPFELKELLARIEVQIRRGEGSSASNIITFNELSLDKDNYLVSFKGEELNFTRQEYKILELLLSYPNKVFSKQDIYNYAWDDIYIGEDNTINVHISNIRQKLKKYTDTEYIDTVWGIGFRLKK